MKKIKLFSNLILAAGLTILITAFMEQVGIIHFAHVSINPYDVNTLEQINFHDRFIICIILVAYIMIILSAILKIYILYRAAKVKDDIIQVKNRHLKYLWLILKSIVVVFILIMIVLTLLIILLNSINCDNIPS
jgi:hypothetical protein